MRAFIGGLMAEVPGGKPPALKELRKSFVAAPDSERVARLIDLADYAGLERNGGFAASVVKEFGQGQNVVDAVIAAGEYAEGDQWKYVRKVLTDGTGKQGSNANRGAQGERVKYGV